MRRRAPALHGVLMSLTSCMSFSSGGKLLLLQSLQFFQRHSALFELVASFLADLAAR
jgi:hypothetical protein